MNVNLFYQKFGRIFNNGKQLYSSKDSASTSGTPQFYIVVERKRNPIDEINQYLTDLFTDNLPYNRIALDKPLPAQPTRVELSSKELLERREEPMYFTINEEIKMLDFESEDFKTWFRNEIIALLDLIELYKKNNRTYTMPKSIYNIRRSPLISSHQGKLELDNELYSCYKRVICLYSLITTDVIQSKDKRKGLFKELNFVKVLLEVIIYQMDIANVRIDNFIDDFVIHYPNTSFGSGSSKRLHDIVWTPEDEFAILGDVVANSLINLL